MLSHLNYEMFAAEIEALFESQTVKYPENLKKKAYENYNTLYAEYFIAIDRMNKRELAEFLKTLSVIVDDLDVRLRGALVDNRPMHAHQLRAELFAHLIFKNTVEAYYYSSEIR